MKAIIRDISFPKGGLLLHLFVAQFNESSVKEVISTMMKNSEVEVDLEPKQVSTKPSPRPPVKKPAAKVRVRKNAAPTPGEVEP